MVKRFAFPLIALVALAAVGAHEWRAQRAATARSPEAAFRRAGKVLLALPTELPSDVAARSLNFTPAQLRECELYLRHPSDERQYLHFRADGSIWEHGRRLGELGERHELMQTAAGWTLFFRDLPRVTFPPDWRAFLVASGVRALPGEVVDHPRFLIADSFMRDRLEGDDWKPESGHWGLQQHGGGMPTSAGALADYNVQRAVNPFSVFGKDNGILRYAASDAWPHFGAEVRMYFGIPRTSDAIDQNTLPSGAELLLVVQAADGLQYGFGWVGKLGAFASCSRSAGDQPWEPVQLYRGPRPPLTNWVRVGLELRNGTLLVGRLEGVEVLREKASCRLAGPVALACGKEAVEFDDFRAWSLPAPPAAGQPVYVKSRLFAGKTLKNGADPVQFQQWARSSDTFVPGVEPAAGGSTWRTITARLPLFGDFAYESVPFEQSVGELPAGEYEFRFFAQDPAAPTDLAKLRPAFTLAAVRTADGWQVTGQPTVWPSGARAFTLRWRRAAPEPRLALLVGERWLPVGPALPDPVHVAIAWRLPPPPAIARPPAPEHHVLTSANLRHEYFEEAPTAWNWVDGSFRMDCRWACQNQWNFMACGAPGVPFLVGKTRYWGDQEHEYFLSLRPVYPSDAGVTDFHYDPGQDPGLALFSANGGWYNRHDLNFSFCTDGRNPLSGYAVLVGADDNTESRLLRRGRVVARNDKLLLPQEPSHGAVHWRWWHLQLYRYGKHLRVLLDNQLLFEYDDPEPLPGGHAGFWTVRNGFTVSRVTSVAARVDEAPHFLYVRNAGVEPPPAAATTAAPAATPPPAATAPAPATGVWRALIRDTVELSAGAGAWPTRARFVTGAGMQAVVWQMPAPVDLQKTPVLELPLRLTDHAIANLLLDIGGRTYILELNAPLTGIRDFPTPEFFRRERFQIREMPVPELKQMRYLGKADPRAGTVKVDLGAALKALGIAVPGYDLRALYVANCSNDDYLLAGHDVNQAGAGYDLGPPMFR